MPRKHDDDLFKESTMTFGEHLEELRVVLFRAVIGLLVGVGIGLYFGEYVVEFIQRPLILALEDYYQEQAILDVRNSTGHLTPAQEATLKDWDMVFELVYIEPDVLKAALSDEAPPDLVALPVLNPTTQSDSLWRRTIDQFVDSTRALHRIQSLLPADAQGEFTWSVTQPTESLRRWTARARGYRDLLYRRDLYTPAAFPRLSEELQSQAQKLPQLSDIELLRFNRQLTAIAHPHLHAHMRPQMTPLLLWRSVKNDNRLKPKSLNVQEGFMIWMKASILLGLVVSSPWVFYQIWSFVAAGLYPHERKYVHIFLPVSLGLFLLGASTAFFFVFEPVLSFLLTFNRQLGIDPDPRINEWLGFALVLPLGFGISFQLPLVMLFLERIGIFSVAAYLIKWRIAVLVIFVVSAVLTPADPYSLLLMAIPLTVLYFGGILLCKWLPRKKAAMD